MTQSSPQKNGKAKKQFFRCPADQYLSSNMSSSTDDLDSDVGSKKRRKKGYPNMDITKKVKVKIEIEDDSFDDVNKNNENFIHSRSTEFDSFSSDPSFLKTKSKIKSNKLDDKDYDINEVDLSDNVVIKKHKKKKKNKHHGGDSSLTSEETYIENNNIQIPTSNVKKGINVKKETVDNFCLENGGNKDNFDSSYEFDTLSKKCKKKKRERYKEDDDENRRTSDDMKIKIEEEKYEGNSYVDDVHTKTKKQKKRKNENYDQSDNLSDIVIKKESVNDECIVKNELEGDIQVVDAQDVEHHAIHQSKKHKKKKSRDCDSNEEVNVNNFPIVKSELIINDDFQENGTYEEQMIEKGDQIHLYEEPSKRKKSKSKSLTEDENNTGAFSEGDSKKKGNKNNSDNTLEQNLVMAENVNIENDDSGKQKIIYAHSSKKKKKTKDIQTESSYSEGNQNLTSDNETYKKKKSKLKKSADENGTWKSTEDGSENISNSSGKNLSTHENHTMENGDSSEPKKKKKKKKKRHSEKSDEELAEQTYESIEATKNEETLGDQENCNYKKKKKKHKDKDHVSEEVSYDTSSQSLLNQKSKKNRNSPKKGEETIGSNTDSFEEDEDFSETERVPRMRKDQSIFDKYPKIARILEESDDDEYYPHLQYRKMTLAEAVQLARLKIQLLHEPPPQHQIEKIAGTRNLSKKEKEEFEKYTPLKKGRFDPAEDKRIVRNWKKFCKIHNWKRSIIYPFLHEKRKGFFFLSTIEERRKFVQFLARKLPDRCLYSVYYRFKNLYSVHKTNRYTKEEDEIILREVANLENKYKFAILSKKLNRTRCSVWRRYRLLKQKQENEKDIDLIKN